jgi:hypothetical protein
MRPLVLYTNFLNEELLLPAWLEHHAALFDHGVLVDCGSNDRSLDIIREFCPTWEVVHCPRFGYGIEDHLCAQEIEAARPGIDCWKLWLTVAEFLVCRNLRRYVEGLTSETTGVLTDPFYIWSSVPNRCPDLAPGWVERETLGFHELRCFPLLFRARYLHRHSHAKYPDGRHGTLNEGAQVDKSLPLAWLGRGFPRLWHERNRAFARSPEWPRLTAFHQTLRLWDLPSCVEHWREKLPLCYDIPARHPEYAGAIR